MISAMILSALLLAACTPGLIEPRGILHLSDAEIDEHLHVPSPEWQDQVIYFLLTDRFNDGDTDNNDQGWGDYRPQSPNHWNGGDLQGILDELDYIKGMGMTTIWLTPPVRNAHFDPDSILTGYHGYWQEAIRQVDPHLGSMEDYRRLSATLHRNGMYLMQDVVTNHMGDYFRYVGPYNPEDLTENFEVRDTEKPLESPFDLNDVRIPEHREAAIYHFTPDITDYGNQKEKKVYSLQGLDDLNTTNPTVMKALRYSFGYWIREAGVDAFRFDTPLYVDHEFWHDFMHNEDSEAPGMLPLAASLGKDHFYNIGETWLMAKAFSEAADLEAATYLGSAAKPELSSILNFPLQATINRVFRSGGATSELRFRMEVQRRVFEHPELLGNFIDNHDAARFLDAAGYEQMTQALLFLYSIPGVPVIYYGTEQEFSVTRGAMFAEGSDAGGKDHFDQESRGYRLMADLGAMRAEEKALRRGEFEFLQDDEAGAGLVAYAMRHEDGDNIIVMNTASHPVLADFDSGMEAGVSLEPVFSLGADNLQLCVNTEGKVRAMIPAGFGAVYKAGAKASIVSTSTVLSIALDEQSRSNILLSGEATTESVQLLIDKAEVRQIEVPVKDGRWSHELSTAWMQNGAHEVNAVSCDAEFFQTSSVGFQLDRDYEPVSDLLVDPKGDDHGPDGRYSYPMEPSYKGINDIEGMRVFAAGSNLRIDIDMAEPLSTAWLPSNGFDHLRLAVCLDVREGGQKEIPGRNYQVPEGMEWDYMLELTGWSSSIFDGQGNVLQPGPRIETVTSEGVLSVFVPAAAIGYPESVEGMSVYVSTWDQDEFGLRRITPEGSLWEYGGGSASDPKYMDETGVLELSGQPH